MNSDIKDFWTRSDYDIHFKTQDIILVESTYNNKNETKQILKRTRNDANGSTTICSKHVQIVMTPSSGDFLLSLRSKTSD